MNAPLKFDDYNHEEVYQSLHTVNDYIRWARTCLHSAELSYHHGYNEPLDEAIVLVLACINMAPPAMNETLQSRLSVTEKQRIVELLSKRITKCIPLAYLINRAPFAGIDFYVDERVLIPRSPIAELIENHFEPWLQGHLVERVLDLCCGGGCIGLAAAYEMPNAAIDLVDISSDALAVAKINTEQLGMTESAELIQSDLFSALSGRTYDLIITNPPYVPQSSLNVLPSEFDHEPEVALLSGEDGLDHITVILTEASKYLSSEGWLCAEVGEAKEALEEKWPQVPFIWPEFERGGDGVFLVDADTLKRFF